MNGSAALHTGDVSNPFWQGLADTEFVSTFCKPVGFEHLDQLEIGTLTPCFEEVIILGTIHGLTLVLSLVHVARLSCGARVAHAQISSRKWQRIKACLVAVSALIPLMQLNAELGRTSASIPPFELLGFLLSIAALLSLLAWLLVELTYGTPLAPITTDGFGRATRARGKGRWQQWFVFMFLLAGHTIKARRFVITGAQSGARYFLWLYGVQYISLIVLCVLDVGRPALFEGYQAVTHEDDEAVHLDDAQMAPIENVCPEQQSSLWSRMTFSWVTPLLKIGYKRALTPDDIFKVDRHDQTVTNVDKFNRLWRQEWVSKGQNASLLRVLLACFGRDFAVGGLFKIGNDASQFVGPIALGGLLQFVNDRSQPDWVGYSYALLLLVGQVLGSLCEVQYFQRVMRVGMQVRAVLIAAGYRKSVCLGPQAATEFGSGKLANLLSNDTDSLKDCCQNLHTAWSSPLRIIVALGMLLSSLGPSALTAVVVIVAFIPVQARMAKLTAKFKKETAQFTDSRLKVSGELFGAMAIVKMYAWEIAFEGKVNSIRNDELVLLRRSSMFSAVNTFLINVNPVLVSLLTFVVYAVTEGDLTAEVAFTALSLFNILRMPMIMLPNVITSLTTAQVSVERLCALLVADEVDETSFSRGASSHMTRGPLISVSQASFSWDPREPQPTLRGVELEVSRGQVVVVIGTTGSGKSSLLSALLQELPCVTNQSESPVTMTGSIAYAAQQSWLFNASVRENIIFGLPYEPDRYYDAVRVAQLERDFELLPAADETEIGEKGSNLSGGQRQRISLARAAYARADIYLLDDPLSALDAKVGRLVFEQLVMGTLRSSAATIMVTNQLQYCSHADQVVVMKHGEIAESGPYEELLRNRGEFFELMREHGGHEDEDEDPSKREDDDQAKSLATKQTSASAKPPSVESQPAQSGKLMSAEGRSKGTVSVGVISSYVAKAGGTVWFGLVSLTFVLVELLRALSTWWLGVWSSSGGSSIAYYMGIYALISIVMALCQLYNAISLVRGGLQAAKNFWEKMFDVLLHAPMSFYATTPLGRIINRLTGDMTGVDQRVAPVIGFFIRACIQLIGALAVIGGTTPYTLATFVPILYMFYICQNYYQRSARELKRMDAVSRSPINSHLSQTIDGSGVATIRAYGAVERMCLEIAALIDNNSRFYLAQISANRWLSCRLEAFGGLLVFSVGVFAVFGRAAYDSTIIGMSLSNALQITSLLNIVVRVKTMAEMQLNSVERVEEYTQIDAEALHIIDDHRPPHPWPRSGSLAFENVQMRYREGLPLTLKGCSFRLSSGDRCGVVGRTGAGKSSLLQALFRLCEIEDGGRITLDGQNLAQYGLTDVRSKIAIIPQEPVIFSGTVRSNLDPFGEHSDSDIWKTVERAKLYDAVCAHPLKLDRVVAEGGANFSIGQRQLICLARAILKRAVVLCLDEATANIDVETDALIQLTVRNEFSSATTLTIAHRLNTIIDSDVILVLDAGKVAEFDTPSKLLSRETIFSSMVDSTGPATSAFLRKIADGELRPEHEDVAKQSLTQTSSRTSSTPAATITGANSVEDVRRAIGVVLSALKHPNKLHIDKQDLSQESWNAELQAMLGQVMAEAHSHHLLGSGTLTMLSADAIEHDMHDAEHRTLSNLKTH